jgi:predicted DsbA family dithiol-disulfide isomerase
MKAVLSQPVPAAATPHLAFDVYRIPFFLEPDYPADETFEETNRVRLHRKWGGERQFEEQKQRHRLKERGVEAGLRPDAFNLDRVASSTLASHTLVQWAGRTYGLDASERLYDRLNTYHFEEGRKLNDAAALAAIAGEEGMDEVAAAAYLASGKGRDAIVGAYHAVQRMGISGIPCFVVDGGRSVLSGAVHADELTRVFREIEAEAVEKRGGGREKEEDEMPGPVFAPLLMNALGEGGSLVGAE